MSSKITEGRNSSGASVDIPSVGVEGSIFGKSLQYQDFRKADEWNFFAEKSVSTCEHNVAKDWDRWTVALKMGPTANSENEEPCENNWVEHISSEWHAKEENSMTHPENASGSAQPMLYSAVQPPFSDMWQETARSISFLSQLKVNKVERGQNVGASDNQAVFDEDDSVSDSSSVKLDDGSDSDDFPVDMDEYESDTSEDNYEMRKKNKWFKVFFETMDILSVEQINEPTRRWHCPACQCGCGSIAWYKGLQSLITHARTKGGRRIRLHRELAELLEEESQLRGASIIVAGESFGKWKGLQAIIADRCIIWPPMVMIMNTLLEQDKNDKWVGMGSQELLEYFPSYAAAKARHSYGPHGHRGTSVLIFEASPVGYMEAERLDKHFTFEGKDRKAWEHHGLLFCPGGKRQLYGFLAHKSDLDDFNRHSQGKSQLKFEMKSYEEVVLGPMKQISEDSRQLVCLKNKIAKFLQYSSTLEGTLNMLSQKLQRTVEENIMLRHRMEWQHRESIEELNQQEQFWVDEMEKVHAFVEEKERFFADLLPEPTNSKQQDLETVLEESHRDKEDTDPAAGEVEEVKKILEEIHVHEERKIAQ